MGSLDGLADPGTYHPATGNWKICLSARGYAAQTGVFGGPAYAPARE